MGLQIFLYQGLAGLRDPLNSELRERYHKTLQEGVVTTRGLTTRVLTTRGCYNQGLLQLGVLQPGVFQPGVLKTRGLTNRSS